MYFSPILVFFVPHWFLQSFLKKRLQNSPLSFKVPFSYCHKIYFSVDTLLPFTTAPQPLLLGWTMSRWAKVFCWSLGPKWVSWFLESRTMSRFIECDKHWSIEGKLEKFAVFIFVILWSTNVLEMETPVYLDILIDDLISFTKMVRSDFNWLIKNTLSYFCFLFIVETEVVTYGQRKVSKKNP